MIDKAPKQKWKIHHSTIEEYITQEDEPFMAVLSDPPYGLNFMGSAWDHGVPGSEIWNGVHKKLLPGSNLLAFGGTRTFHRLTVGIEDGGFAIRDVLMYLYSSGFPKSHDINRGMNAEEAQVFEGYGTAVKPAYEPIIWGMKDNDQTFAHNAEAHGVSGINIDGSRVEHNEPIKPMKAQTIQASVMHKQALRHEDTTELKENGRWPANVLHDGQTDNELLSRYFYCAKANSTERDAGVSNDPVAKGSMFGNNGARPHTKEDYVYSGQTRNDHPTVKPIALCTYLAKLILPPYTGRERRILVPFSGSGSEMIGCLLAGWDTVHGVEMDEHYISIANQRLDFWYNEAQRLGTTAVKTILKESKRTKEQGMQNMFETHE